METRYKTDYSAHTGGLSPYQGRVLQAIQRTPLTQAQVQEKVGGTDYSVSSALGALIRKGLAQEV